MKKRVLLAGDRIQQAAGALRDWPEVTAGWELCCAPNGAAARRWLVEGELDAAVVDAQLGDMRGTQLLEEVGRRWPQAVRLVYAPAQAGMHCLGQAYQWLCEPASPQNLWQALRQAWGLAEWLPDNAARRLVARFERLPSPPTLYFRLVQELESPVASLDSVAELVGHDAAVTAKLLQWANGSLLGLAQPVTHPADAVLYLGVQATRALVLLAHTFSYLPEAGPGAGAMQTLAAHSLQVGRFARTVAETESASADTIERCFTAGLLHDLGKVLLVANLPQESAEASAWAQARQAPLWQAEREVLGACHADVGGWLLGLWGLPGVIVEAVAKHHQPVSLFQDGFCPLTAVHVANVFAQRSATKSAGAPCRCEQAYLARLGCEARLTSWEAACWPEAHADARPPSAGPVPAPVVA